MPVERLTSHVSWRDLQKGEQSVKTMSCSDKLMRWNVLGLQGSLLSQYLEPVYLSSITLGLPYFPYSLFCTIILLIATKYCRISYDLPDS